MIAFAVSFAVVANFWWIIAFAVPVAGLALLLLTWPAEALVAWRAPDGYRDWG